MPEFIYSVLSFVAVIGILITVHEFGHFWVARKLGVKVLRFSIGFGRPLWSGRRKNDDTEYVLALIPLGGYVKMLDENEGPVAKEELSRAFNRKPLAVRAAVVVAGPLANFLFAIVACWIMYVSGIEGLRAVVGDVDTESVGMTAGFRSGQHILRVGERETQTWDAVIQRLIGSAMGQQRVDITVQETDGRKQLLELPLDGISLDALASGGFFDELGITPQRPSLPAVIGRIEARSPAAKAGLLPQDRIVLAASETINSWGSWVAVIRARPDQDFAITIERQGLTRTLTLRPKAIKHGDSVIGRIGAAAEVPEDWRAQHYVSQRYGMVEAIPRSLEKTWDFTTLTLGIFWKMLTLEISSENLSGPISIAQYAGHSAQAGLSRFLEFLAIVSVSLGVLNLLPIPILDGGHLMYYFIELCSGRPPTEAVQLLAQRFGIAVIIGLMSLALYNDLARLLG